MCLSKVYVDRNGERELLMEEVSSMEIAEDRLLCKTLFGEQKEVEGNIREIDFLAHTVVLGKPDKPKSR